MRRMKRPIDGVRWLELSAGPLLAVSSVLALAGSPAEAQPYRSYAVARYEPLPRQARADAGRPRAETARPRSTANRPAADRQQDQSSAAAPQVSGPLLLLVSLQRQSVAVYSGAGEVARSPISSGRAGFETPTGVFSIIQKNKEHYSNLYDDAPMPNMQRITWSGVALHAGQLPGYPASHGCLRLPMKFSQRLFAMTQIGTRVIVTNGEVAPVPFAHRLLFTPLPPGEPVEQRLPAQPPLAAADTIKPAPAAASMHLAAAHTTATDADATAASPSPRTRAGVAAARAAEKLRLADEVSARRQAHAQMLDTLKTANETLEQARQNARVLKLEAERARRKLEALPDDLGEAGAGAGGGQEDEIDGHQPDRLREREMLLAEAADLSEEAQAAVEMQTRVEAARTAAMGEAMIASEQLKSAINAQSQFAREEAHRAQPVSVFISRRTSRLYVRQGFEPMFEAPVVIKNAELPLGTHVYTALLGERGAALSWSVVTIADAQQGTGAGKRTVAERNAARKTAQPAPATQGAGLASASAALERIEIPIEVRERIEEIIKPGSSLIISDLPASKETGRGTDFILLTR